MNSNRRTRACRLAWLVIFAVAMRAESADRYRDATVPIDQRVEDLLGRMTLEEKVGQMNMPCVYEAGLTGLQEELVKAVQATGTPTVVVLINGRPLATRWIAQHATAIVEAWLPGEKGGQAVAEALFGDVNPSGRMSVTVPRHAGQLSEDTRLQADFQVREP